MKERTAKQSISREEIRGIYQQGEDAVIALVEGLLNKIEQLEVRLEVLENQANKDSRNSRKPPSSDGLGKRTKSLRGKSERQSGEQIGHEGNTLEWREEIDKTIVHGVNQCESCGTSLVETEILNSIESFRELLSGTFLSEAAMTQLNIPMTQNVALAIAVNLENSLESWHLLKDLLPQTQRYPVITTCWGNNAKNWQKDIINEDLFSRFYFGEEYPNLDLSPEAIITRANSISTQELDGFLDERARFNTYNLEEQIFTELANTSSCFGTVPLVSEMQELMRLGQISTIVDVEKYLFDWELQHTTEISTPSHQDLTYLDWYQPTGQTMALILLPTTHSWETLAYLAWYGGSKMAIPLLKKWHQLYDADLVCHYGTMLQFLVGKQPSNPQAAFRLASEQVLLAPCTTLLSGVSIRDHARSILKTDRWFIHERP